MADIFDEVSTPKDIFDEVSVEGDIFDSVKKDVGQLKGIVNSAKNAWISQRQSGNISRASTLYDWGKRESDFYNQSQRIIQSLPEGMGNVPILGQTDTGEPVFYDDQSENLQDSEAVARRLSEDLIKKVAEDEKKKRKLGYSEAMREWNTSEGFVNAAKAFAKNPFEITANIAASGGVSSIQPLAQGVVGGIALGPLGSAIGAGQGTYEMEYTSRFLQAFNDAGIDLTNPDQIIAAFNDREMIDEARRAALRRGLTVGAFEALSGGIAGRISMFGRGFARTATEFATEAALEGAGEVAGTLAAGDELSGKAVVEEMLGSMGLSAGQIATGRVLGSGEKTGGEPEVDSTPPTAPTEDGGSTPPASINPDVREELDFVENPPVESVSPIAENIETEEQAGVTTVDPGVEQLEIRDIIDQVGLPEGVEGDTIIPDVTPQQDGAPVIRNTVALKKEEIGALREVLELAQIQEGDVQHWTDIAQNVKAKGLDKTADQLALALVEKPRVIDATEQITLAIRETQLQDEYFSKLDEAEKALDRGDIPRYQELTTVANGLARSLDTVTQAGLFGGREIGRALAARRARINRDIYTIAKVRQRVKQAKANAKTQEGRTITQAESKEYADLVKRLAAEQEKIARLSESIAEMESKVNREDAETFFNARKMRSRKVGNIAERRASYKQRLKELGYRTNDITNIIGLSAEASSLVSKIAETYIEEGVANLTDLTNKMKQDLPDLSENDIYNALGGRIAKKKRQVESRVKKQLKEMKKQARLWADVHSLLEGPLKTKRIENKSSAQVRQLRDIVTRLRKQAYKTINEDAQLKRVHLALDKIQDQIEGGFRYIPEGKEKTPSPSPALTQAKQSLKEARQLMLGEDILADLDEQIRTDEFAIPRQQPQIANARLRKVKQLIAEKRKIIQKRKRELANTEQAQADRLLKKLGLLEQQIEGGYRFLKNRGRSQEHNTVQIQELKDTIRETERLMRTQDSIQDLLEQLRTGEYKVSAGEKRVIKNAELQDALTQERALKRLIDHKIERERRSNLPWYSRERALDVIQTPRTLLATADHSAVLRQGLILSFGRPIVAAKAVAAAEKAFWNEHTAHQIDIAIRNHPNQIERDAAGLFLSEIDGAGTSAEENFFSSMADRLPFVAQSSRHMATYLNLLRVAAFDDFITKHPEATIEQRKAYADYVNIASGRGDLGKFAGAADWLSVVFFAPRFTVSRIQALYTPLRPKYLKDPLLRKAIAKDYAAFVGTGLMVLALAAAFGADVGLDPEDSDFGKIVVGDTRVDIWGGLQQPARLIAMTMMSFFDGDGEYLDMVPEGDIDPTDAALRFTTYKFAPWWSGTKMLTTGKDAVGNKVTLLPTEASLESLTNSAAFRLTTPLILQETLQVMAEEEDPGIVALSAGGTFWGLGVNTYEKKEK